MELINGNKYWSCKPSIESFGYDDCPPCILPWQGILVNTTRLCRFDENNVVDDDTNASAYVKPDEIFATEAEALLVFKDECRKYASELRVQAEYYEGLAER